MKLIAFILSLLILSSAVIPCYVFDNCEEQELADQCCSSEEQEEDDCEGCSPFSVCSGETGFAISYHVPSVAPVTTVFPIVYFDRHINLTSEYYSTLFQPPRHAC